VQWADNGEAVEAARGELKGLMDARDDTVPAYTARLDALARQVIEEVNRLHSQGNGLTRFTDVLSGTGVSDAGALLGSAAGLPYDDEITAGSFWLAMYDADGGLLEQQEITVDPGATTLNSLAAQINSDFLATGNLQASVVDDHLSLRLGSGAPAGATFSFVKSDGTGDTSGVLLALGLNTFFTGNNSETINVSSAIQDDANLVATAGSTAPGDNTIALAIGNLRNQTFRIGADAEARTFEGYHEVTVSTLATESASVSSQRANQENVVEAFQRQREATSGVNLDEELANLIGVEHAYTAAARYIATINSMLDALLNIA
jgi:flagellar hook-associated protein 1 FlgK